MEMDVRPRAHTYGGVFAPTGVQSSGLARGPPAAPGPAGDGTRPATTEGFIRQNFRVSCETCAFN